MTKKEISLIKVLIVLIKYYDIKIPTKKIKSESGLTDSTVFGSLNKLSNKSVIRKMRSPKSDREYIYQIVDADEAQKLVELYRKYIL